MVCINKHLEVTIFDLFVITHSLLGINQRFSIEITQLEPFWSGSAGYGNSRLKSTFQFVGDILQEEPVSWVKWNTIYRPSRVSVYVLTLMRSTITITTRLQQMTTKGQLTFVRSIPPKQDLRQHQKQWGCPISVCGIPPTYNINKCANNNQQQKQHLRKASHLRRNPGSPDQWRWKTIDQYSQWLTPTNPNRNWGIPTSTLILNILHSSFSPRIVLRRDTQCWYNLAPVILTQSGTWKLPVG